MRKTRGLSYRRAREIALCSSNNIYVLPWQHHNNQSTPRKGDSMHRWCTNMYHVTPLTAGRLPPFACGTQTYTLLKSIFLAIFLRGSVDPSITRHKKAAAAARKTRGCLSARDPLQQRGALPVVTPAPSPLPGKEDGARRLNWTHHHVTFRRTRGLASKKMDSFRRVSR